MMWDHGSTSWNRTEALDSLGSRLSTVKAIAPTPMCWPIPLSFSLSAAR